uniref:Uncharacterized protein n=1 Tax=Lepeophtheirus salmonis TaxID=72036 RepID=A0A0K2TRB7_LEPSM
MQIQNTKRFCIFLGKRFRGGLCRLKNT